MTTAAPTPATTSNRETFRIFAHAIRYVAPFKGQFAIKGVLLILSLLPMLVLPWPIKLMIDHVIEGIPISEPVRAYPDWFAPIIGLLDGMSSGEILGWLVGLQVLLFVLVGSFGTAGGERDAADARLANGFDTATRTEAEANAGWSFAGGLFGLADFAYTMRLTQAFNHHYRSRLFERIQQLPMTTFDDEAIGDAVYRVMYDTPSITDACYRLILTPIAAPLSFALTAAVLAAFFGDQPFLFWSALALLPIAVIGTLPLAAALRERSSVSRRAGATTTSTAEEGISNILAVQSLGGEGRQRDRFDRDSWSSFGRYRGVFLVKVLGILCAAIPGTAVILWAMFSVCDMVIQGVLSRGDFALLMVYYVRLAVTALDLGALWFRVQESAAGLQRVFLLMDMPGERDDAGRAPVERVREGLRLEGVGYCYPDGTRALDEVDLELPRGRVTAIAGPAGAGKSTLAYLIPRFIDPTEGRIELDGRPLQELDLRSLREQIAFVFQETVLFDGTIEDNIRLGRPDASPLEIRRAAILAGADEFVQRLPRGYQTHLGPRGGKLSVGQKQRLSIARALVRDSAILILDEPTSALDPETERALVASLREAARDRVVIVIAHRLSTIRAADQIVFIEDGRIVERGDHATLMRRADGHYRRFVELQGRGAA